MRTPIASMRRRRRSTSSQSRMTILAAVAAAPFEIAAGGRAVLDGRHDFEKARADREKRVDEAVFADIAVAVADREAEDVGEVGDGGLEGARDQTDLAQPQIGHGPSVL